MTANTLSDKVRRSVFTASSPGSLTARTRARRWEIFRQKFPDLSGMRVLDLGGTVQTWTNAPLRPGEVLVVNLKRQDSSVEWITTMAGNACDLPAEVTAQEFDLVYSNSVIEHVGGHAQREAFARTVREGAPRYWVQTPYRYFPIEPHWIFPGFQFLPVNARAAVARSWKLGHRRAPAHPAGAAVANVLDVELLSKAEMRHYFPDAELLDEPFLGLTKSLISVRTA